MTNHHHLLRGRFQIPPVVFPLLALLLVFLTSTTQQHIASSLADHGYVGNLDHLVAISHNETIRALSGSSKDDTSTEWLADYSIALQADFYCNAGIPAASEALPVAPRFLLPLLRAPPLT